jgi:hypothetical protein
MAATGAMNLLNWIIAPSFADVNVTVVVSKSAAMLWIALPPSGVYAKTSH